MTEFEVEVRASIQVIRNQKVEATDGVAAMNVVCRDLRETLPEVLGYSWIITEVHVERKDT